MLIDFEKWHGCKNDFIVFWIEESQLSILAPSLQRQASYLCDRNVGIGADGILILAYNHKQPVPKTLLIYNQDGSVAKTCGNGIRCAALSIYQHVLRDQKTELQSVDLRVESVDYFCEFLPQKGELPLVQVNMGVPKLNEQNSWHQPAQEFIRAKLKELKKESFFQDVYTCSLANSHLVFVLDGKNDIEDFRLIGKALQKSPLWDGINVSFVCPLEGSFKIPQAMRQQDLSEAHQVFVWERGVGPTQACGSAGCAVAASLLTTGFISRAQTLPMVFPGGPLFVKQNSEEEETLLIGAAARVFGGQIEI